MYTAPRADWKSGFQKEKKSPNNGLAAHESHIIDMPVYCIIITFIIYIDDTIMFALHDDDEAARVRADIFPLEKTDFHTLFYIII